MSSFAGKGRGVPVAVIAEYRVGDITQPSGYRIPRTRAKLKEKERSNFLAAYK